MVKGGSDWMLRAQRAETKLEQAETSTQFLDNALKEEEQKKVVLEKERDELAKTLADTKAAWKMLEKGANAHG